MGLYQGLENYENKLQLLAYESQLKLIDDSYIIYRTFGEKRSNLDIVIRYCLDKGTEGLKYYFSSFYKTDEFKNEYLNLEQKLNEFVEIQKNLKKRTFNLVDLSISNIEKDIEKTYGKEKLSEISKLRLSNTKRYNSIEVTYKYLEAINEKYPELIDTPSIKTNLFLSVISLDKKYEKQFSKFKSSIDDKIKKGEKITDIVSELIKNGDIKVDTKDIISTITNTAKKHLDIENNLKEELNQKLPKAFIKNDFISETERLKNKVQSKIEEGFSKEEALKLVLPEAYGLVKAAIKVVKDITPYDVQMIGAIALNNGEVAEMYTGEGKTITAIFPAYLNALTGDEVDIFTPNDYLASRDAEKNKEIFELLGMSVGCTLIDGQTTEEKQRVYKKDIIYGSSTAFAFDFLHDTDQMDPTKIVQRDTKPGFVIVDEADQILINNALSPYCLEEGGKPLTESEKKDNVEVLTLLNRASIFARKLSESKYIAKTETTFNNITGGNESVTSEVEQVYSLIVLQSKTNGAGRIHITEKGMNELFTFSMREEIEDLTNKTRTYFEGNPAYKEGEDYNISAGKFTFTQKGLKKASEETDEFFELKLKFLSDEKYSTLRKYVSNALTAEYLMEKGKDYTIGRDEKNKEVIKVLQDGVIIPDSKFTDGIHEAITLKEGLSILPEKNERLLSKGAATLSNRALLSRYDKISGMTGTADRDAFYEIYGMNTFNVPRNKQYLYMKNPEKYPKPTFREDLPDKLYKTKSDKIKGIFDEVVESHKKGQPVLVVVDSIEEATMFNQLLTDNGLKSNLLIADKNLQEENEIIASAGEFGAITVATEMAGRGTDIKLGGEKNLDRENLKYRILVEEALNRLISQELLTKKDMPLEEKRKFIKDTRIRLLTENKELPALFTKLQQKTIDDPNYNRIINERIDQKAAELVNEIQEVGGLKYIQMNPFKTSRNDNQGKGRVGRQGETGTTRIYASLEELPHLGVDREDIRELDKLLGDRVFVEDSDVDFKVSEVIEMAQSINEFNMDMQIASTDTIDLAMSSKGMMIFKTKKALAKQEDVTIAVENMIDSVIVDIVKDNVGPRKVKKVNKNNTRLSRMKLNPDTLCKDIESTFGVLIEADDIFTKCTDVGDLKQLLSDKVKERKKQLDSGISKEVINSNNKKILNNYLNEVYVNFMEGMDDIQKQMINDRIAQNSTANRYKDIDNLYFQCRKDGWRYAMNNMFKVKPKEEKEELSSEISSHLEDVRNEEHEKRISIFNIQKLEENVTLSHDDIRNKKDETVVKSSKK